MASGAKTAIGPTAVDLFAGPGGMTAGLKSVGFSVIAAVEVDDVAAETYSLNHPEVSLAHRDIRTIDGTAWLESLQMSRGQLSLLAACPPCQGFSVMRRRNKPGPFPDSRNDLVLEVARFADEMLPQAVMMENVPGLLNDKHLNSLAEQLSAMGFNVGNGPTVLDASDYGVPQRRKRLVLIATRQGPVELAPKSVNRQTVRDAIAEMPVPGSSGDPLHDLSERRSIRVSNIIKAIPKNGGSRTDLPDSMHLDCHRTFDGFKDVYGRMHWDRPAPTITGGCFNPSKGRFLHPEDNRNITLREAAILQGFDRSYMFSLRRGKVKAAEMIGNALPPPFVAAHAQRILERISSDD